MSRQTDLDRLSQLHDDDLAAVVAVVECTILWGDGWLQCQDDGKLRLRDSLNVTIIETKGDEA